MAEEYQVEENQVEATPEEYSGDELVDTTEPVYEMDDGGDEAPEEEVSEAPESDGLFRDEQYVWGRQLGLTREQVEGFGSPEAFDAVLEKLSSEEEEAPEEPEAPAETDFSPYILKDAEDYDEGIVNFVEYANSALKEMKDQVSHLRGENSRLIQAEYARNAETNVAEFERIVNTMDEATFGRGTQDDLVGQEADNRMRLAEAVSRLGHGYEARGEEVPSMARLVEEAKGAVFGTEIKNHTLRKASERSRQQRSQSSAVPTHEEASPLTPDEAAIKAATEWQQEQGWR